MGLVQFGLRPRWDQDEIVVQPADIFGRGDVPWIGYVRAAGLATCFWFYLNQVIQDRVCGLFGS